MQEPVSEFAHQFHSKRANNRIRTRKKKSVMKGKWYMFQTILENTFKMSLTFAMQFIQQKVIHIYEALN